MRFFSWLASRAGHGGPGFGLLKKTLCLVSVLAFAAACAACSNDAAASASPDASSAEASNSEVADGEIYADIDIADYGTITVELDPEAAPVTVENFVKLANEGFYDGLTFHRIMDGFMMQGGDPTVTGNGGSGETIIGEFSSNGHKNPISHVRGTISMARANDPDSASSQFFIVDEDSTFLDGEYAGFGHVTEGLDVVDAVTAAARPIDNNGTISREEQPVITTITIRGALPDASSDAS